MSEDVGTPEVAPEHLQVTDSSIAYARLLQQSLTKLEQDVPVWVTRLAAGQDPHTTD